MLYSVHTGMTSTVYSGTCSLENRIGVVYQQTLNRLLHHIYIDTFVLLRSSHTNIDLSLLQIPFSLSLDP